MKRIFLVLILAFTGCSSGEEALAVYRSGVQEFSAGKLPEAERYFLEALEMDADLLNARLMLAKIYYYNKNYAAAISSADSMLGKDPDHAEALYWKARSMVMSCGDNNSEPVSLLVRSLEIEGHNTHARLLLGMIYEKNSQYTEALHQYMEVVEHEEDIISARCCLSILYRRMGFNERAERELAAAERIAVAGSRGMKRIGFIKKEAGVMQ